MISEEEKNKYIENINRYLDNLINICCEKSNMQDMTATGIKIIKQPIFLIFDDLLNKIERIKNLNEHQSKEITKAVEYTFELNKEIEIKDKMIDDIKLELREHLGFENRLKKENRKPDEFNQGCFYVAQNIKDIIDSKR